MNMRSRLELLGIDIALVLLLSMAYNSQLPGKRISGVPRSAWSLAAIELRQCHRSDLFRHRIPIFT